MLLRVYTKNAKRIRDHCGAEPAGDLESAGLFRAVRRGDRAAAWHGPADRVQTPARATRGWFRGVYSGRSAPLLSVEAWTAAGTRRMVGPVPPLLVGSRRCSGAPPRPHASINTNQ